jgi:hypothetical protein
LVTDDKELFVTHYGTDIYLERLGLGVHCSSAEIVHALELQYYHLNWLYTQIRREEDTPFVRGMKSMNDMKPFAIRTRTKYGFPPVKRLGQGARGTSYFKSEIREGNRRRRGHPE